MTLWKPISPIKAKLAFPDREARYPCAARQALLRLPRSNAIVFSIRCYLISLEEIRTSPVWTKRIHRVLKGLNADLAKYKGLTKFLETAIKWLAKFDDRVITVVICVGLSYGC